jgi:hypothetical protein
MYMLSSVFYRHHHTHHSTQRSTTIASTYHTHLAHCDTQPSTPITSTRHIHPRRLTQACSAASRVIRSYSLVATTERRLVTFRFTESRSVVCAFGQWTSEENFFEVNTPRSCSSFDRSGWSVFDLSSPIGECSAVSIREVGDFDAPPASYAIRSAARLQLYLDENCTEFLGGLSIAGCGILQVSLSDDLLLPNQVWGFSCLPEVEVDVDQINTFFEENGDYSCTVVYNPGSILQACALGNPPLIVSDDVSTVFSFNEQTQLFPTLVDITKVGGVGS